MAGATLFDPGGCGCVAGCGDCCVACSPCPIPKADLTLAITSTEIPHCFASGVDLGPYIRSGSATLGWNGSDWRIGSPEPFLCGGQNALHDVLLCSGGAIVMTLFNPGTASLLLSSLTADSFTCSPFSITWTVDPATGGFAYTQGLRTVTVTGPSNSPYGFPVCCQTFRVTGCSGLALPGATVSVYDGPGGALLASEVTPASGLVTLWWSGSCDVYATVTATGYASYAQSLALTAGGSTTVAMSEDAEGYLCCAGCVLPKADLHYTYTRSDGGSGSGIAVWSGTAWLISGGFLGVSCVDGVLYFGGSMPCTGGPVTCSPLVLQFICVDGTGVRWTFVLTA